MHLSFTNIADYMPVILTLKTYTRELFYRDLMASLTVMVVAIPQSMAYAMIVGIDPVYGLYTAIIGTILGSLFGSSEHLIAGPTNAISLLLAGAMRTLWAGENAYQMLFLLTLLVGIIQVVFGLLRLGRAINYVSHAVLVGFSAGAGVLIACGQLNQLLGISIPDASRLITLDKLHYVINHLSATNPAALGLGAAAIVIILAARRIDRRIPGALLALVLGATAVVIWQLDTYGVKLTGLIPSSLPRFVPVHIDLPSLQMIGSSALAIAIIGLVEAISIAKAIAVSSRQKIDANREFIGQGIANIGSSFFQSFAGSGSFTRSAINHYSGAATRMAGIFSGLLVALMLMGCGPFARYIPLPALAGVIIVIGISMVRINEMRALSRAKRQDAVVLWITFGATVLVPDLDWAIYSGIVISIVLYLLETGHSPVRVLIPCGENNTEYIEQEAANVKGPQDVMIVQLEGNLYFGSAEDLEHKLASLAGRARAFILRLKRVSAIDTTALEVLRRFVRDTHERGGYVLICGVRTDMNETLLKAALLDEICTENVFPSEEQMFTSTAKAVARARELLQNKA